MLGVKLKYLRKKSRLKQSDLAVILGVSRSQLSHYEQNFGKPSYDVLMKMCNYFGVPLDYFSDQTGPINELVQALELSDDEFKKRVKLFFEGQQLTDDELKKMIEFVKFMRFKGE